MGRTALQIGEEFSQLQETRVQTYNNLNHAHKEYLASAPNYDFKKYQKEVADATEIIKDISSKVISLRKEIDGSELDTFIEKVQEYEAKKLQITVKLQLARQKLQDDEEDNDSAIENVRLHLRELNDMLEEINDSMEEIRYILADMRDDLEKD